MIRHGETEFSVARRYNGVADTPMTPRGGEEEEEEEGIPADPDIWNDTTNDTAERIS
jgi:broad specificity phosphatase PhoE